MRLVPALSDDRVDAFCQKAFTTFFHPTGHGSPAAYVNHRNLKPTGA
ncbi:hypothetical protein VSU19_12580 [Verrucomicrobiales bacterium BCK34]|nr:hypothetical protein [Verrucomicrobiales bacterium BCK34]